ncbi:hypothetical protein N1851_025735 [Merluccius polli]|uniref:Uncharacterized protein n=1 Tax=Merluccius polli TaxID=89951 RepID=A0AA47MD81_MERPO|nr:hypothetical protein N1851_025735 [Merluccius polli]
MRNLGVVLNCFTVNITAGCGPADLLSTTSAGSGPSTQLLVQALVISRLDYCNSLLAVMSLSPVKPLQCIQNPAARLVFKLSKFSHVTAPPPLP